MKIIVEKEPYVINNDITMQNLYSTKCEIDICSDAGASDYINALIEGMKLETFNETVIYNALRNYVRELEYSGILEKDNED